MKHLRTFTLSALVISLVAFGLPTQDVLAYLSRRAIAGAHRRGNHRYCQHSRAWWRRYRQRQRERVARAALLRRQRREAALVAARARAAAGIEPAYVAGPKTTPPANPARNGASLPNVAHVSVASSNAAHASAAVTKAARNGVARNVAAHGNTAHNSAPVATAPVIASAPAAGKSARADLYRKSIASASPATAPVAGAEPSFRKARAAAPEARGSRNPLDFAVPQSWRLTGASAQGTLKFAVADRAGRETGTATLSPVTPPSASAALDVITPRTRLIGGVALPVLRRTIIDRMVLEGGWVTNDMERTIDGRTVYVVVAQKGQAGVARESWTFYFTELDGRLYSLATNAPVEFSSPVAVGSEQLLATLRAGAGSTKTAQTQR